MTTLYAMPGNEAFAESLSRHTGYARKVLFVHHFPDGETLAQMEAPGNGDDVLLVCTLDRPDAKLWPLMMAASTARELGARRVGLVAPYLAYMRQDARFRPGEAISSNIFGAWLGRTFDGLVTVDPHLHRHQHLAEIYSRPSRVVHVVAELTAWIAANVDKPLIVGPDGESTQWATAVANLLCAPSVIAQKVRHGDHEVDVHLPEPIRWDDHTPVLLDDIISTGKTLVETVRRLRALTAKPPVCVAAHGVFAEGSLEALRGEGVGQIVTSNTIANEAAQIDVSMAVADATLELCATWKAKEAKRAIS